MKKITAPAASYRLAVATRYWRAARVVLANQVRDNEFMEPVGHLLSMAVELALKAFLSNAGVPGRELKQRKIGHDLGALLHLCVKRGLEISEGDAAAILIMRTAHLEHFHRYGPDEQVINRFTIVLVKEDVGLSAVARLLDLIGGDPALLRSQHQHPAPLDWPQTLPPLLPVQLARLEQMAKEAEAHAAKTESFGLPHTPQSRRKAK